jgi:hypothetical protein
MSCMYMCMYAGYMRGFLELAPILERRNGNVLTSHSILKSDYFNGCQDKTLPVIIDGAPNFRLVNKVCIYLYTHIHTYIHIHTYTYTHTPDMRSVCFAD